VKFSITKQNAIKMYKSKHF